MTPDELIPGHTYEVVAPVEYRKTPILPGTMLKFVGSKEIWHEGYWDYRFKADSSELGEVELSGGWPDDVTLINSMDHWLKPLASDDGGDRKRARRP
jgi:hypothetical protein